MTSLRSVPLVLAGLIGAAAFAGAATAGPGPARVPHGVAVKSPLMGDVVVPTAATLPGSSYPWVQPVWVTVGTVTLARAPAPHVGSPGTEPIWKMVDGIALARVF